MADGSLGKRPMKVTDEEMKANQINIAYRDHCAPKLIELNQCRWENYYLPWTCNHEKHSYEKCQYKEYLLRAAAMVDKQAAIKEAASS